MTNVNEGGQKLSEMISVWHEETVWVHHSGKEKPGQALFDRLDMSDVLRYYAVYVHMGSDLCKVCIGCVLSNSVFYLCVCTACVIVSPPPHNLNLPSGVCESFTIIILAHVWLFFVFIQLFFFFHWHKLFFPCTFGHEDVSLSSNWKDFYCQSKSQYL